MRYTRRSGEISNQAERVFARFVERAGKTAIHQPRTFPLPEPHRSYRPDFYVVEDACFYEVLGTYNAYYISRRKVQAFRAAYPHLRFEYVPVGWYPRPPQLRTTPRISTRGRPIPVAVAVGVAR